MKLYTFWRSSAAYRVRIALNVKGVEHELVPVHLRRGGGEHRRPEFLALNPQGVLPVLDDDGTILIQSLPIIEYLDHVQPNPRLIPADPVDRARVQGLAQIIACEMHPLNNLRVLEYLRRGFGQDEDAVTGWYAHWVAEGFRSLEALIGEWSEGEYCFGSALSLADVCLVPQVYNARRFRCDLSPYPRITAIADRLAEREAFMRAAPENQPDAS